MLVKLDFANAFNTIRRDSLLETTAEKTPELYKFVLSSHSCEAKLTFGPYIILSREGSQQGDPLSGLEFCDIVHPILSESQTKMKLGYMDDFKIGERIQAVASDVARIMDAEKQTDFVEMPLNAKSSKRNLTSSKTISFSRTLRMLTEKI